MVKWAIAEFCPVDASACSAAAQGGHLDILRYLREKKVAWNEEVTEKASEKNHFHVVRWASENGAPMTSNILVNACANGAAVSFVLVETRELILIACRQYLDA